VQVQPTTLAGVADAVTALLADRPGRVRAVLDGPPPTEPGRLAADVAERLRARGRAALVADAADFLRPASVRLELGREDPDALLDLWLDEDALRREVLRDAGPVLPRLWNAAADRSWRAAYVELPHDAAVLLHGTLLLGRGLPAEVTVHLHMGPAALARHLPAWQLPAYARYERERTPAREAALTVLADHPERPALRRR
jgi:hypothetical protein